MKTIIKNGFVVNVFTEKIDKQNILIENSKIVNIGNFSTKDVHVDVEINANGKYICPSFIDSHIHIESTQLNVESFAHACAIHGTCTVIADPHEIANVCGIDGIKYMIQSSKNLPLNIYYMLPSCVPATEMDENGAKLSAKDLRPLYKYPEVLGLGEVMDFPGVIAGKSHLKQKLNDARKNRCVINGHAPLLSGDDLTSYILNGITDDHECTQLSEAKEKIEKGQIVIIREGSSAKNLKTLIPLFKHPYSDRCLLCCDDINAYDLSQKGHIDNILKLAVANGAKPIVAIKMATIQAAQYYNLKGIGAIAPGFRANITIVNNLKEFKVSKVLFNGNIIGNDGKISGSKTSSVSKTLQNKVTKTFNIQNVKLSNLKINLPSDKKIRAIEFVPNQILTKEIFLDKLNENCCKVAVFERHKNSGHIGLGFIKGLGIKNGAIASSVSHDSHNLIVCGKSDKDMVKAANQIIKMQGGLCVVKDGKVLASNALTIAGLMSKYDVHTASNKSQELKKATYKVGFKKADNPFMALSFLSLTVIPELRISTKGLIQTNTQKTVPLFI